MASAQPQSHVGDAVRLERVAALPAGTVGLAHEPVEDVLYVLTGGGDLYRVAPTAGAVPELVATSAEHGAPAPTYAIAIDAAGTIYLVGNRRTEATSAGVIRRGAAGAGAGEWSTVAETVPYPYGRTAFDHAFSAVAVHPDGTWLALNSGSRTDHGEVQDGEGAHPGVREVPLTSAILRVPTEAVDLVIPADPAGLVDGGYLFADGTRNSFGLAFDADGELFGTENSGDRDDGEELNWLRQDHHYGFPWRMGTNDTPQRFPGYDPDADPLLNPASEAYRSGAFYDDPTYPAPPDGVAFTDPLRNLGPDADLVRRTDGTIVDASESGLMGTTFTPHRSPLGLVFRRPGQAVGFEACDAFMLSWTGRDDGGSLLAPFPDGGEDLLCLGIDDERTEVTASRIVSGFQNPIASALISSTLYVAEYGAPHGLWAVSFQAPSAQDPEAAQVLDVSVVPNPLRRPGALVVTLSEAREAHVTLIDGLGRTIATLHDGPLASGTTRFDLGVDRLATGVYVAVVEAGDLPVVQTFTVVR